MNVCNIPGCGTLTTQRRCAPHAREHEQARGTRQQRGYDSEHERTRKRLDPLVQTGTVRCWRCRDLIHPGTDWELGHTDDRTAYAGPEHPACNRAAGGRKAHGAA